MPKLNELERESDLRHVAESLLEPGGGGRDIIEDELSSFTSNRPVLGDTPEHIIEAMLEWIGNSEAAERDE